MSKHTPGPWKARNEGSDGLTVLCDNPNVPAITLAELTWGTPYGPNERDEANARLIAAAPDLLEAARDLLERLDYHLRTTGTDHMLTTPRTALRAAIAKAEGGLT